MYIKLPIGYFKFIIEIFFAYEREDIYLISNLQKT